MRIGCIVYCPVAHGHPIAQHGLPTEWSYWERTNRRFLEMCDELIVVALNGWEESVGVQAEIRIAIELENMADDSYRYVETRLKLNAEREAKPSILVSI